MRILLLTPWFPRFKEDPDGSYIFDSLEALLLLGHEVTIVVSQVWRPKLMGLFDREWAKEKLNPADYSERFNLHVVQYLSIPRNYLKLFSIYLYRRRLHKTLTQLAQQSRAQLILAHTELPGLAAIDVAKKLSIPAVVVVHGMA